MQTTLRIPDHQTDYFEKKAAELDIIVRKDGKHSAKQSTFYDVNYSSDIELVYLVDAMGLLTELEAAHKPTGELLN